MAKTLMDLVKNARSQLENIDFSKLAELQKRDDFLLLDVREESEYKAGHIPGCLFIPRGILETAADLQYAKKHPVLSEARKRPIVLYCASGGRSALAAMSLREMGFEEVYNLDGGFELWSKEGKPVETA